MTLDELLASSSPKKKIGLSEERIQAIIPVFRQYVSFWREYPDIFIDMMQDGGNPELPKTFKFYFYQRVFVRACMRYKYVYMVFPRARKRARLGQPTPKNPSNCWEISF